MAEQEYLIKGSTLTGIADAIRSKTGVSGSFSVNTFATKINSISGGSPSTSPTFDGMHWDGGILQGGVLASYSEEGDLCISGQEFFFQIPAEGSNNIVLLIPRTTGLQDFNTSLDCIPFLVWDFYNNTFDVINSTGNIARSSHDYSSIRPLEDDYFTLLEGDVGREFPFATDIGTIDEGTEVIGIVISW